MTHNPHSHVLLRVQRHHGFDCGADADVITIETSRSDMELLESLKSLIIQMKSVLVSMTFTRQSTERGMD